MGGIRGRPSFPFLSFLLLDVFFFSSFGYDIWMIRYVARLLAFLPEHISNIRRYLLLFCFREWMYCIFIVYIWYSNPHAGVG